MSLAIQLMVFGLVIGPDTNIATFCLILNFLKFFFYAMLQLEQCTNLRGLESLVGQIICQIQVEQDNLAATMSRFPLDRNIIKIFAKIFSS